MPTPRYPLDHSFVRAARERYARNCRKGLAVQKGRPPFDDLYLAVARANRSLAAVGRDFGMGRRVMGVFYHSYLESFLGTVTKRRRTVTRARHIAKQAHLIKSTAQGLLEKVAGEAKRQRLRVKLLPLAEEDGVRARR